MEQEKVPRESLRANAELTASFAKTFSLGHFFCGTGKDHNGYQLQYGPQGQWDQVAKLMLEIFANQIDHPIVTCEVLLKLGEKRMRQGNQDIHGESKDKYKILLMKTLLSCNLLCAHNFIIHRHNQIFIQLIDQQRSELEESMSSLSAQLTALV